MRDWGRLFTSLNKSGIYTVNTTAGLEKAQQAALSSGLEVIKAGLEGVSDKEGFLAVVAEALRFPQYFGMNWDALEECLTDLSWLPAAGYLIFISGLKKFTESTPADMETARQVFKAAVEYWKEQAIPFFVILSNLEVK